MECLVQIASIGQDCRQAWMQVPVHTITGEEAALNKAKIKDLEEISESEDHNLTILRKKSLRA